MFSDICINWRQMWVYHNGPEDSKTKIVDMRSFDTDIMVEYITSSLSNDVKLYKNYVWYKALSIKFMS